VALCLIRGLAVALFLALAVSAPSQESAESLFRQGAEAQRDGRYVEAYVFYNQARALDPANDKYIQAAQQVQENAAQMVASTGDFRTAIAMAPAAPGLQNLFPEASTDEPLEARITVTNEAPERVLKGPVQLKPKDHISVFRFRGSIAEAYEEIAEEFGLDVIFDEEFDGEKEVRVDLFDCDFRCVMLAMRDVGQTLLVPLTDQLFLLADDNANNRRELEPVASITIPLNDALTTEEVTQIGQAIQQTLEVKRFQMSPTSGLLFMRDTVTKVRMAHAMVDALMHPRGAVMIELSVISVSRDRTAELGITLPDSTSVTNFSTILNAVPAQSGGSLPLIGIGGGDSLLGVTIGNSQALATMNSGTGSSIQTLSIRTEHGMPAELKLGERYPIVTAQFSAAPGPGVDDAINSGNFSQPIPSFTFEDLGLNMKATPLIHSANEVTLELETEFRLLAGGAVNGVPILANREFHTSVRLRQGEFAIISGMAIQEQRNTRTGTAGLAHIPFLGQFFSRHRRQRNQSELLIVVRPRVIRLPPAEVVPSLTFRFGPEQRPLPAL